MGKKIKKTKITPEFMDFLRRKSHGQNKSIFDDILKQMGLPPLPPIKTTLSQALERLI